MEILQISGDKPEFSNFIGDTMVLKEKRSKQIFKM